MLVSELFIARITADLPCTRFHEALPRNKLFSPRGRTESAVRFFWVPGFEPDSPLPHAELFHLPVCPAGVPVDATASLPDREKGFESFACIHISHGEKTSSMNR